MPNVIALVVADAVRGRLGTPRRLASLLDGRSVLAHTLARLDRVAELDAIVVVHPQSQDWRPLLGDLKLTKPLHGYADVHELTDRLTACCRVARLWNPNAWRGGLGGATAYDELLPGRPLWEAFQRYQAQSALLVGGDWCLVDPDLCSRTLALQRSNPQALQLTFTQAPPGLCGVVVGGPILHQMAESNGSIGHALSYQPTKPQADPIGRDVCVQIAGEIRSCAQRLIYDTPRASAVMDHVLKKLGRHWPQADALAIVTAAQAVLGEHSPADFAALPGQVTVELTPRRVPKGPVTPQHEIEFDRLDMPMELFRQLAQQIAQTPDTVLLIGGLGDALLHGRWHEMVHAAHKAGVSSIGIETDLLCSQDTIDLLLELPVDLVTVRLNADTGGTYEATMDRPDFGLIIQNMEYFFNQKIKRQDERAGLPWILPRIVKTADTLGDIETFFDRWMHFCGHAIIEPATSGCGLKPDLSPVMMAPPKRSACRQLSRRMSVHSDGRVAMCDQDWLGHMAVGDANQTPLADLWRAMDRPRCRHASGQWTEVYAGSSDSPFGGCAVCDQWHRP